MTMPTAERIRRGRDLRGELSELEREQEQEIIFKETSPQHPPVTLYAMSDGEPIPMTPRIAAMAIAKQFRDGTFMFTDKKEEAPEYKLGTVKCFLHPESPERESGLLEAAGIAQFTCGSARHPSRWAMEEVAKSKHRKQWAALKAYEQEQERQEDRAAQRQQLDATLALARQAAGVDDLGPRIDGQPVQPVKPLVHRPTFTCEKCQKPFDTENQLRGHRMGAHKGEDNAGSSPVVSPRD